MAEPQNQNSQRDEVKLIELLKDSGLISPKQLEKSLEEQQRTGDSLYDILRRDASLQSFKDLLWGFFGMEIPLPFGKAKRDKLKDVLLKSGIITDEELQKSLSEEEKETHVGELLREKGILTEEQLEKALKEQKRTGHPFWRVLINLDMIKPTKLVNLMQDRLTQPTECAQDELIMEFLSNTGLISEDQRKEAERKYREKGVPMIKYLIEKNYISAEKVGEATEQQLQIPFIHIKGYEIDPNVVYTLPEDIARSDKILPVARDGNTLKLAMINPLDSSVINRVKLMTGLNIQPLLAKESDLEDVIDEYFKRAEALMREPISKTAEDKGLSMLNIPAVQLASSLIEGAINSRATDIHLEPQLPSMRVRFRIDGMLYDVMSIPESIQQSVFSRIKILANMDITERRRPQDGHITMKIRGKEFNMRVATIPTHLGEKMVMRVLDETNVLRGMKQLGLEAEEEEKLARLINKPYGILLVTGPIGSGKTTTLYAALNEINILQNNIVTIEDPIEYRLAGINQVQVNYGMGLGFAECLRAVLRQDADTLMVGEIRDDETAKVATWAALTGQLVFATLHTNDASSAITMMANFNVRRFFLASALVGVAAQRLVRRICPKCKETYKPSEAVIKELGISVDEDYEFARGVGCDYCKFTGYYGRMGVFEIMEMTETIKDLILEDAPDLELKKAAIKEGMNTLWMNGIRKIKAHITTPEEVLREVKL